MLRLLLLLLGVDYLRKRSTSLMLIGLSWLGAGVFLFIDSLDGVLYFPLKCFALFLLTEGLVTLATAGTGIGGQRILRYVKGVFVIFAAILILMGKHDGNIILAIMFGTLYIVDGLLQAISAYVVRFPGWKSSLTAGAAEILSGIFFCQPYPDHYVGVVPYCVGLFLFFGGTNLVMLSVRVRFLARNPSFATSTRPSLEPDATPHFYSPNAVEWDGPPKDDEHALTVHIWTPAGSAKSAIQRHPIIDRYIGAVDINGVISTGHAALESPEGVYISLYPGIEMDRSPEDFSRVLRATHENDAPGVFQVDYLSESKAWLPSTVRVRIRNYDPVKLADFWVSYQKEKIYNLTNRNCSSSVAMALEAAIDGSYGRLYHGHAGWGAFLRLVVTPELWVAMHIRKRAVTMAWTPGLVLDYARALSVLADPRPFSWRKAVRRASLKIARLSKPRASL